MAFYRCGSSGETGTEIQQVHSGNTGLVSVRNGAVNKNVNRTFSDEHYTSAKLAITRVECNVNLVDEAGYVTGLTARITKNTFDPSTGKLQATIHLTYTNSTTNVSNMQVIAYYVVYAI